MTDEQIALAHRAGACKGWRWMPGMLTMDEERMSDEGWPLYDTLDYGSSGVAECVEWHSNPSLDALPDLTDPATLGCLLALVREAWCDPGVFVRPRGSKMRPDWAVFTGANSDIVCAALSEAEALVTALERAP
jgi:hypothetical protein